MAGQSKAQKDTMERVMHEFKEGELTTGSGKPVRSRRQAVAIGLSESGSSDQQSPAENRQRLKNTKRRERTGRTARDETGPTRADLYRQAQEKDVPGRSKMTKAELARAVEG